MDCRKGTNLLLGKIVIFSLEGVENRTEQFAL